MSTAVTEDVVDREIHCTHSLAGLMSGTILQTYPPFEFD